MKVKVSIIKTYYKTADIIIDVPDDIDRDDFDAVDLYITGKGTELSDRLADASLNADMDGIEIEDWSII